MGARYLSSWARQKEGTKLVSAWEASIREARIGVPPTYPGYQCGSFSCVEAGAKCNLVQGFSKMYF